MKKIGIMTSGGDCAGLNAAIRAVTLRACDLGAQVLGFRQGSVGLLKRDYIQLTPKKVTYDLLTKGGSFLGCINKGNPFHYPTDDDGAIDVSAEIGASYKALGLDVIVSIGGDGSFSIMSSLMKKFKMNVIGVPKTIDNDLSCTDYAIGYSSSVQVIANALDNLQTTAESHQRIIVVQTMGRDAGHLALEGGIAGGADVILIPEISYSIDVVASHLKKIMRSQKKFAIVVVAESIKTAEGKAVTVLDEINNRQRYDGSAAYIASLIEKHTGFETRPLVLGHLQRGGGPNAFDRVLASKLGVFAADLAMQGTYGRVVVFENNVIKHVPIEETISTYNHVDVHGQLVHVARGLGICLGDA
jgi:ATP-dependent phosphofructokinase / diphosphate-dependent phosphofructokinase